MESLRRIIEIRQTRFKSWKAPLNAKNHRAFYGVDTNTQKEEKMTHTEIALSQVGIKEIVGKRHNPEVLKFFATIGEWVKDDETAWCSAFVNWVMIKAGKEYSGKLNARSWLNVGVKVDNPLVGDVVVLWRESPSSWKGHVGFFVREQGNFIYILGGNQNNQVCVQAYQKNKLLEYRRV